MFSIAILIGVYAYLIFTLGTMGLLFKSVVFFVTVTFGICLYGYYRTLWSRVLTVSHITAQSRSFLRELRHSRLMLTSLILLCFLAIITLVGALGPEYAFDALWYHLTLPKLYVLTHTIQHIPGGLLYYSDMPRIGEMLYTVLLLFTNEISAKVLHWIFGLCLVGITYHVGKKYLGKKWALLASLVFYSNIAVAWESTTAYIDLIRAFFEILAFWGFLHWFETKKKIWFIESAVMVGLAIGTKILASASLVLFATLITYQGFFEKLPWKTTIARCIQYCFIAILIASPWFILAYVNTGNPFYPIFSGYEVHQTWWEVINPFRCLSSVWTVFTHADDPINPIYLILFPLGVLLFLKKTRFTITETSIFIYSVIAVFVWYSTPQTGGGRFMIPYLPVLSIASVLIIKRVSSSYVQKGLIGLVILLSVTTIFYRGSATIKFIPVLVGQESKTEFLIKHLNFNFGDFYDTDGYFARTIQPTDTVLLYGFHNLYYVDFPFIDSSWVKKGDIFTYIAVQNMNLPSRFSSWKLVYINHVTHVNVYTFRRTKWIY